MNQDDYAKMREYLEGKCEFYRVTGGLLNSSEKEDGLIGLDGLNILCPLFENVVTIKEHKEWRSFESESIAMAVVAVSCYDCDDKEDFYTAAIDFYKKIMGSKTQY